MTFSRVVYRPPPHYPKSHPSLQVPHLNEPKSLCVFDFETSCFAVELLPENSHGVRSHVRLLDRDMRTTLNRAYTLRERTAFHATLSLVSHGYTQLGLVPQVFITEDEAMSSIADSKIQLGNHDYPYSLAGYVIGRGIPKVEYVPSVPYEGPEPGKEFNLTDKSLARPWTSDNMKSFSDALNRCIRKTLEAEGYWFKGMHL